jgi:hypothetical protein
MLNDSITRGIIGLAAVRQMSLHIEVHGVVLDWTLHLELVRISRPIAYDHSLTILTPFTDRKDNLKLTI